MSPEEALKGAQAILDKRADQKEICVVVDSPNDSKLTVSAFRSLNCKVKIELYGARLRVTRKD